MSNEEEKLTGRTKAPFRVVGSDEFLDLVNDLINHCDIDNTFLEEYDKVFSLGDSFDLYVVGIFAGLVTVIEKWNGDVDMLPSRKNNNANPIAMSTFHPSTGFYDKWDYNEDKGSFFSYYVNDPSILDMQRLDNLGACISL